MPHLPVKLQRFEVAENGCWNWTGSKERSGRGRVPMNYRWVRAYRAVYEALRGPIPAGLTLDHLCRNVGCVNPDHLEPCSRAENYRRFIAAGGRSQPRKAPTGRANTGERLYKAKLTPPQVLAIRADERNPAALAAEYGVSKTTVERIRSGRLWRSLLHEQAQSRPTEFRHSRRKD